MPQLMLDGARSAAPRRGYGIELAARINGKKVYPITQLGSPSK